jgi:hypothetical protein
MQARAGGFLVSRLQRPDRAQRGVFMRGVLFVVALPAAACTGQDGPASEGGPAPDSEAIEIVSDDAGVSQIVADQDRLYYTSWGGSLRSANLDGGDIALLADDTAYHLVEDANHLYWTTDRDIRRVRKADGRVQIVARLGATDSGVAAALWLAVDDEFVYASTYDQGTVVRAPKTGGDVEVVARTDAGAVMGPIDVAGDRLYWAEYGWSGPVVEQDLAVGQTRPIGETGAAALRVVDGEVWLVHERADLFSTMELVRIPLDGSEPVTFPGQDFSASIADDGRFLYWIRIEPQAIARIDPVTNGSEVIARDVGAADPEAMAINSDWIFVADGASPGGILRLPRPME